MPYFAFEPEVKYGRIAFSQMRLLDLVFQYSVIRDALKMVMVSVSSLLLVFLNNCSRIHQIDSFMFC